MLKRKTKPAQGGRKRKEDFMDHFSQKCKELENEALAIDDELTKVYHRSPSKSIIRWRMIGLKKRQFNLRKDVGKMKALQKEYNTLLNN